MKTSIIKVAKEKLPECLDVIHRSFATVADEFGLTRENCPKHTSFIPLSYLEAQMKWGRLMFGLYTDERIIGYMSLSKEDDETYELHNLAILPEFRHSGFGKQMLDYAKEYHDPELLCRALMSKALNRGARDNVTVLAVIK